MNEPNVDEVISYLSTRFNKIFCDREFVANVLRDFQLISSDKNKCCVVVFPVLESIYQRAVRYQAKIFNLEVISIECNKFRSVAVCHKDILKKIDSKEDSMCEEAPKISEIFANTARQKRPARQLYVPPAQRSSQHRSREKVTSLKSGDLKVKSKNVDILKSNDCKPDCNIIKECNSEPKESSHESCSPSLPSNDILLIESSDSCCAGSVTVDDVELNENTRTEESCSYKKCKSSIPDINGINLNEPPDKSPLLPQNSENAEVKRADLDIIKTLTVDTEIQENRPNLDMIALGCKEELSIDASKDKNGDALTLNHIDDVKNNKSNTVPSETDAKNGFKNIEIIKTQTNNKESLNNKLNEKIVSSNRPTRIEREEKPEIISRVKKSRKSRPILKYVDDGNDLLKIDGTDENLNNWEDLFDEDGLLQGDLLTDITQKVGEDVTIVTALEDYSAYSNKTNESLEHVVELFDFPPTFETHDIMQTFSYIKSDAMYIKWVDDTHALLVLGSLTQAQRALEQENPLVKVRPMTIASSVSLSVANKCDLKPAMKRPQTNLQTARRLITTHLGAKSKVTKEQSAKEREDLKNARELKKLSKQNEKDAWEGNLRSAIKH